MLWYLQISVSVIFFIQKIMILRGWKSGWLIGAIAGALAVFYFYMIDLHVYVVLEFGLIVLMGYGFVKDDGKRGAAWIRVFTALGMIAMTIFAYTGFLTIVELVSSAGMLLGTFMLTHGSARSGWVLYGVAHVLAAYLGYGKEQTFFADFQLASAIVSALGAVKPK